jgi:hypothetical protein
VIGGDPQSSRLRDGAWVLHVGTALLGALSLALPVRADSASYEDLVARAREAMRSTRPHEAALLAADALRAKKDGHEAAALLGAACYQLGRREDARVALGHAVACAPRQTWAEYSWLLAAADPEMAARRAKEEARKGAAALRDGLNYRAAEAYWLAWLHDQRDDHYAVLAATGYELTGSLPEAAILLGAVRLRRGKLPDQLETFAKSLQPRIDEAHRTRKAEAKAELEARNAARAREAAVAAVELGPGDGEAYLLLARAQAAAGRPAESFEALLAAIRTKQVTAGDVAAARELIAGIPPEVLRPVVRDAFGTAEIEKLDKAYREREASVVRAREEEERRKRAAAREEEERLRVRAARAAAADLRERWTKAGELIRGRSWFLSFESEDGTQRFGPFPLDEIRFLQRPSGGEERGRTRLETQSGRDGSGTWSTAGWITATVATEPDEKTRGTGRVEFEVDVEHELVKKRLFGNKRESRDWKFRASVDLDTLISLLSAERPELLSRSRGYLARLHTSP